MPISLRRIVRWVEHHGYWNPWDLNSSWFDSYSRNRKVDKLHRTLLQSLGISIPTRQRLSAVSFEETSDQLSSPAPPVVDAVVVTHPKDFGTLPAVISSLMLNSINPIRKFLIYVPEYAMREARELSLELSTSYVGDFAVVSETTLVPDTTIQMIRDKFGKRFGWLLQQILKLEAVLKGDDTAKLIVDADTVILSRQLFLDHQGRQLLHVSSEYQESYYAFLSRLADLPTPFYTHVSHHMVMQRDVLNEIMTRLGVASSLELLQRAIEFCDSKPELTVSLDYEFYAQFAKLFAPERVQLSRMCNLAVRDFPSNQTALDRLLANASRHFKSLSFHSYLRDSGG